MRRWPWPSAVAALYAADVVTTRLALDRGAEEANRVAAWAFDAFGFWPTVTVGFLPYLAVTPLCWWRSTWMPTASAISRWAARVALVVPRAFYVVWNVAVIRELW